MRVSVVILPDARWSTAADRWRQAEALGFAHAWTYDHIGWRGYADGPWFGAVPTLTAAAAVTSRIRLGVLVATPNFRHPVPFLRDLLALDDVADGRFVLGLGAGDDGYDARVLGQAPLAPAARADRFAEFVEVLDGLLTTDHYNYAGIHYTALDARTLPGPVQRPRIPFVLAANGPRGMRLAARHGAGWATTGPAADDPAAYWQGVATLADRFDAALSATGRDPATIDRHLNLDAAPAPVLASVATFEDAVERAQALGFTDVAVRWPADDESGGAHARTLQSVAPATRRPAPQQA